MHFLIKKKKKKKMKSGCVNNSQLIYLYLINHLQNFYLIFINNLF